MAIELADGKTPYATMNPYNAITNIKNNPVVTLQNPENWSADFIDFITKCTSYDPNLRSTATELLEHPFI